MLINTVLLFLQNALPIFIITTLLLLRFSSDKINSIRLKGLVLSLILVTLSAFILSSFLEIISQAADGRGIELFLSFGLILVYFSSIGLFVLNRSHGDTSIKTPLAFIIFFIISCLNGAFFIVYLTSYWEKAQQVESMLIGVILGGGICLSIAILLYFLLKKSDQKIHPNTSNYFLLFFTIGQLMHAIVLLQQVDILPSSQPLWDSGKLIAENSELGRLLTVLFGYETTPSPLQFITYAIAFIIPVIISHYKTILLLLRGERS
mgnify:FL=1